MRMRMGPGPVFVYEWLTTTRRWQLYALRALFVWMILIGMGLIWQGDAGPATHVRSSRSRIWHATASCSTRPWW